MTYEFKKEYETGIESIDNEHRKFFEYINQGVEALDLSDDKGVESAKEILGKLTDYANFHFKNEEAHMHDTKDAMYLIQVHYHNEFRERIKNFQDKKDMTKKDIGEIFVFMAKWLKEHILASDRKIGNHNGDSIFSMSDEFLTGIERIDVQHRKLFEIIGNAYSVMEDEYAFDKYDMILKILEELKDYTIFHFGDEEAYMVKIGYEGLDAQKKVHDAFIDKIVHLNLSDMDSMDDNQDEFLKGIMDFLTDWLINHILLMDKKIPKAK